jgi:chromosome segregation ATPase
MGSAFDLDRQNQRIVACRARLSASYLTQPATRGWRGQMSTAGKVLIVLIILASLGWIVLTAGVTRLNTNGNQALDTMAKELEKTQAQIEETEHETTALKDETGSTQEKIDHDLTVLRSRVSDLEDAHSQITETLTQLQYQVAVVGEAIVGAKSSLQQRTTERQEEEKALGDLRKEVRDLSVENSQLLAHLQTLRSRFESSYHENVEMLGKKK